MCNHAADCVFGSWDLGGAQKFCFECEMNTSELEALETKLEPGPVRAPGHSCTACAGVHGGLALAPGSHESVRQITFKKKAGIIHGFRYSYSKVVYRCAASPVVITCKIHGDFSMCPMHHYGTGCPRCEGPGG